MTKTAAPTSGVDENGLRWEETTFGDTTYRLREITVEESDAAFDASETGPETFNPRLRFRMEVATSIVSPQTTLDDISKWGKTKLLVIGRVYERLNNLPPADTEGNA